MLINERSFNSIRLIKQEGREQELNRPTEAARVSDGDLI